MTGGKPRLTKMHRDSLRAATEEASLFGATIDFDVVGRHPHCVVMLGEDERRIPFASTPRTDSQPNWMRQNVRRAIRDMTAIGIAARSDETRSGSAVRQEPGHRPSLPAQKGAA